mmetsp:Transcript_1653/g.1110  ORF Transcript_1653/g.1110 Transcript_1653/m.1110 type:complete len:111 (+) Transcript_1653:100-432(+)
MRPTLLDFRSPMETTAEFRKFEITKNGQPLNFLLKPTNATGSNFSHAQRFADMPMYCKSTGQTCFLGPGSYNDHETFIKKSNKPCCTVMKKISHLPGKESGNPCYIMIGQ